MAKKTSTENATELPGTPAPRKRREKSQTVIEDETRLREARSLDKVLSCIPGLSTWGCEQVLEALSSNPACKRFQAISE